MADSAAGERYMAGYLAGIYEVTHIRRGLQMYLPMNLATNLASFRVMTSQKRVQDVRDLAIGVSEWSEVHCRLRYIADSGTPGDRRHETQVSQRLWSFHTRRFRRRSREDHHHI